MAEKLAHRIRQAASVLKDFDINDIAVLLKVMTFKEKARIRAGVKGLMRAGEVKALRPGFYRYLGKQGAFPMTGRMWRAMRIKEVFTWRDLVTISGASKTHAHKYIRFLEQKGHIENINGDRSYRSGAYRLVDPDKAPLDHPRLPKRKKA